MAQKTTYGVGMVALIGLAALSVYWMGCATTEALSESEAAKEGSLLDSPLKAAEAIQVRPEDEAVVAEPEQEPAPEQEAEELVIRGTRAEGTIAVPIAVTTFAAPDIQGLRVKDVSKLAAYASGGTRGREAQLRTGAQPEVISPLHVVNNAAYPDMYFEHFGVNPTIDTDEDHRSTFSIDVDNASYTMARSYLERGHLPPEAAIRVEEFVNAFDYAYESQSSEAFEVLAEAFPSPNRKGYHVLHIGLQGQYVRPEDRLPANLVFVIDVSGSMAREDRLGLVKRSLRLLVEELREGDTVGIVVYGSNAHTILEPISVVHRERILGAIDSLRSEGSTNAQAGIKLGYQMVARHFSGSSINRVILCSDGVANNGIATDADGIFASVKKEAERGITISTVGFGMGNYNDMLMERLAQIGEGNYYYVDRDAEARRVFVENLTGTLQVIARDVKIQMIFDRLEISRFRLLGYENRLLEHTDFDDDRVDAGEIGAGHTVTALYEVKFRGPIRDFGELRIRYKDPDGGPSRLIRRELRANIVRDSIAKASSPTRLSYVVAAFAEMLRGSYWVRSLDYAQLRSLYGGISRSLRNQDQVKELGALIVRAEQLDSRDDRFEDDLPVAQMNFDRVPILK
jgi:Ca-activated chloride channel family protein